MLGWVITEAPASAKSESLLSADLPDSKEPLVAPLFQLHMDFPLVPLNVVQLCPLLPPQVFASSPCN